VASDPTYRGSGKLAGKVAVITGGDSGIGRAVAIAFAKEGASLVIAYLNEHVDARATRSMVEQLGGECLLVAGDIGSEATCKRVIKRTIERFGTIDVLVNNAGMHISQESIAGIDRRQLATTFQTNVFSMFHLTKAALPHLGRGAAIINTTSVTAYRGSGHLIDYAASKGAIVSFTRSLSASLIDRGIRVNAVAPGPVWTPLIASGIPKSKVPSFGSDAPMGRAAEPDEIAPCYVFLASNDSSFMTGQVLHPNGGEVVNG
jgi:NAD(P)-dependent dehydrogenase (short-subunit alcohol dehydrogenase family)